MFPATVPLLSGFGLTLREMTEADVPGWFVRASDPESSALSGDPIPENAEVCFAWLETHRRLFRERRGIRWAVVPDGATASIGSIGLSNLAPDVSTGVSTGELGGVIARAYWRQGIGTRAARLLLTYAFADLGLDEIRADLLSTNVASRRVLEKLGFEFQHIIADYQTGGRGSHVGCLYTLRRNPA